MCQSQIFFCSGTAGIFRFTYNLDNYQFEKFLRNQKDPLGYIQETSTGLSIEDLAVQSFVDSFNSYQAEEEAKRVLREKAEAEKEMAMSRMLISSGFTFEGYRIVKYSGYISGDDAIQVDRGTHGFFSSVTNVGESLMVSLKQMRRQALKELKEAAYDLGCNAIIGVDFDYITLEPETANSSGGTTYLPYVFGVTANGNAVIIEKIETNIETN